MERDAERVPQVAAPGKVFRDYRQGQAVLLLPSLDEWLPAEHLARFVDELVEQHLGLGPLYAAHSNLTGFPPYDPRGKPKGPAPGRWCAHTRPPTAGTTASSSAATSTAMGRGRTEHHHYRYRSATGSLPGWLRPGPPPAGRASLPHRCDWVLSEGSAAPGCNRLPQLVDLRNALDELLDGPPDG